MIELSKRMKMNADLVPDGCRLADVGCDHGYVSIYLAERRRCKKILALDVNKGPLAIACEHIRQAHLEEHIECRLSDGLSALEPGEVDAVLIAGMGGMLICRILRERGKVLSRVDNLILQAQSDWKTLRETLFQLGFRIDREQVCKDAGKYYLSIRAVRGKEERPYMEQENTYGRLLPERGDALYHEWLLREKQKRSAVVSELKKCKTDGAYKRISELEREVDCIEWILTTYYGGSI